MTRKKQDKKIATQNSYERIVLTINHATQQPASFSSVFLERLAKIALALDANQFTTFQNEQADHFDINLKNAEGETVIHLLMRNMNEQTLDAILFLLKRGASFCLKNKEEQTPFHLLAIHCSSLQVLQFWQFTKLWDVIRNQQTEFDTRDSYGRTFLHYLMTKPGDDYLGAILQQYFHFRALDNKDNEGNTPLHLAANCGNGTGIDFYLSTANDESIYAHKHFVITNNEGQTPGDLARLKGDSVNARKLYRREFAHSPFHDFLRSWFEKQKKLLDSPELMANHQQKILEKLRQLAKTILIAPSEIDEEIRTILRVLKIDPRSTDRGIEIQLDDVKMVRLNAKDRRTVYELTAIGRLEWMLRDCMQSHLASFGRDIRSRVNAMEKDYDDFYRRAREAYEIEMEDFSEGDDGYDYDGPIVPRPPVYRFNRAAVIKELKEEIAVVDWDDLQAVLAYVPVGKGFLGQALYDDFIGMDLAEALLEQLNKANLGINPVLLSSFILNFDFQFSDLDLSCDGFLITAIQDNFATEFDGLWNNMQAKQLALDFIGTCCRSATLVQDIRLYNQEAKNENPLALQQIWIRMQPCLMKYMAAKTKPSSSKRLSADFSEITQKSSYVRLSEKTHNLIKIFPSDESRTLYHKSSTGKQLTLDLRPLFQTLRTIAQATHQIIVKHAKNAEDAKKTNVITAYLMLAVNARDSSDNTQQKFIRIPVVLDPEKRLLSKDLADHIFASDHEFHCATAEDRQEGASIAHREPTIDVVSAGEIAKQNILRLLSCLDPSEAEKQLVISILQAAKVDKPLQLEYELQSPVQQSTLFNHSERVIFRALKLPANIQRMVSYLYEACRQDFETMSAANYQVEAGCLILYSYPNSVCDECSLGVLALQHSEQNGFVHLLTQALQSYCPSNSTIAPFTVAGDFPLTTIVASERVFPSDHYASILETYPSAKMDHFIDGPGFFSTSGLSLPSSSPSHFYEFVGTDLSNTPPSVPYGGSVTMSGSKANKLHPQNIPRAEEDTAKLIADHDEKLGKLSLH